MVVKSKCKQDVVHNYDLGEVASSDLLEKMLEKMYEEENEQGKLGLFLGVNKTLYNSNQRRDRRMQAICYLFYHKSSLAASERKMRSNDLKIGK